MTPDSDMMALAQKLSHQPQAPLDDAELKMLRRVVRVLEAFSVLGGIAKVLLIIAAGIAAAIVYGRDVLSAIKLWLLS